MTIPVLFLALGGIYVGVLLFYSRNVQRMDTKSTSDFSEHESKSKTYRNEIAVKSLHSKSNPAKAEEVSNMGEGSEEIHMKESAFLTMYGQHRVKPALEQVPKWLSQYVTWSQQQRANENEHTKYLVLPCIGNDICEGFSDRLRALPFYILLASKVNRVLCIYWTKPYPLESFLQPPKGGLDWRCPASFDGIVEKFKTSYRQKNFRHYLLTNKRTNVIRVYNEVKESNETFVSMTYRGKTENVISYLNTIFKSYSYQNYIPVDGNWFHVDLMEHIFRIMFEPIEQIAKNVNATMTKLGLIENNYTSIHVRSRFPVKKMGELLGSQQHAKDHDDGDRIYEFDGNYKRYLTKIAFNAIECGSLLDRNNKIYFVSDLANLTDFVTKDILQVTGENIRVKPLGVKRSGHLKHVGSFRNNAEVIEFYSVVEDLLILGGSKCVSHGAGSFGAFGASLTGNRCRAIHRTHEGNIIKCPNDQSTKYSRNITADYLVFGKDDSEGGRLTPSSAFVPV